MTITDLAHAQPHPAGHGRRGHARARWNRPDSSNFVELPSGQAGRPSLHRRIVSTWSATVPAGVGLVLRTVVERWTAAGVDGHAVGSEQAGPARAANVVPRAKLPQPRQRRRAPRSPRSAACSTPKEDHLIVPADDPAQEDGPPRPPAVGPPAVADTRPGRGRPRGGDHRS